MKAREAVLLIFALFSALALAQTSHVLPKGREIKVRIDAAIPAEPPANAKYTAATSDDVTDSSNAVSYPRAHARSWLPFQPKKTLTSTFAPSQ